MFRKARFRVALRRDGRGRCHRCGGRWKITTWGYSIGADCPRCGATAVPPYGWRH